MRFYYVRFTKPQLTFVNNIWVSPSVDLYNNHSYANYSLTKSNYGVAGVNTTWMGTTTLSPVLNESDGSYSADSRISIVDFESSFFTVEQLRKDDWTGYSFKTDSGEMVDGRFIDTSGRIDLISYNVDSSGPANPALRIFLSETPDDTFYDDWLSNGPYTTSDEFGIVQATRYAKFELTFDYEPDDFELLIRVEIDQPVMAPMYRSTRRMLDVFPEWMAMREIDNDSSVPQLRVPQSTGGKVINALAGRWFDDLDAEITYQDYQKYIDTVDLEQMAWIWRVDMPPTMIWSVTGNGVRLARAASLEEFRDAANEDVCYIDDSHVYTSKHYTNFRINNEQHELLIHQVWNALDDLGLQVDLPRLHLEDNATYRLRIKDVNINRPGVGLDNMKKALRRELNLWKHMATPPDVDSDYDGAYPEILEMQDIEKDPKYFAPDGVPTAEFESLVEQLAREYPTTWGFFRWNHMRWDMGGPNHEGYGVLPYRYDGQLHKPQSGVGDLDDLLVTQPGAPDGAHEVALRLRAVGRSKVTETQYPEVVVPVAFTAVGKHMVEDNPVEDVWLSVEIDVFGATYVHSFMMSAQSSSDVYAGDTYDNYEIFDTPLEGTQSGHVYINKATGAEYGQQGEPYSIPLEDMLTLRLRHGRWSNGAYTDLETANVFEAFFSSSLDDATAALYYNSTVYPTVDMTVPYASKLFPSVVMRSLHIVANVERDWISESSYTTVRINGANPRTTPQSAAVSVPRFIWPAHVYGRNTKLQFLTAHSTNPSGDPIDVQATHITVNGSAAWDMTNLDDIHMLLPETTTNLTFAADVTVATEVDLWTPYQSPAVVTFNDVVDKNGPWRNGVAPQEGNTSYVLRSVSLTRDNFGVPNTSSYVITRINVEADDPEVLTWLDNNTVAPGVPDTVDVKYPPTAIQETFNGTAYEFEPFLLYVRLRTEPAPQWYPQVHSGHFFYGDDEYYLYAQQKTETLTVVGANAILTDVPRQGAPIIVRDTVNNTELRQVSFFTNPGVLEITNTELVKGTGTTNLYLAYADVYAAMVKTDDQIVAANSATTTNALQTLAQTDKDKTYEVTYVLNNSFFVDYDHMVNGKLQSRIVFDQPGTYRVDYEISDYKETATIDLPLSPLYSVQSEGFVYISYNEYNFDALKTYITPTKLVADGEDYALITLTSLDVMGNPKPNQTFNLTTDFGTLDRATVTTDSDGFAVVTLTAANATTTLEGAVTITGGVNTTINFEIEPVMPRRPRLLAVPDADQILADGKGRNYIKGKFERFDPITGWTGIEGAEVRWRKKRTVDELFDGSIPSTVTTGPKGFFTVGPITTSPTDEPGYWFVSVEATYNTVVAGDVVYWNEFPLAVHGSENYDNLPPMPVQYAVPMKHVSWYALANAFPSTYDESAPYAPDNIVTEPTWNPANWWAIRRFIQYQMGLLGTQRNKATRANLDNLHPSVKDY